MRRVKITLTAQTILQLDAGTHEAVREGGNLYVLLQQEDGFKEEKDTPSSTPATSQPTTKAEPTKTATTKETPKAEANGNSDDSSENWTEEDMMNMDTSELLAEAEALGINPDDTDGKNTNKKIRTLILDYWAGQGDVSDDTAQDETEEVDDVEDNAPQSDEEGEYIEIPRDEWGDLKEGTMVLAQLDMGDDDPEGSEKLWEAEVVGWKKPKGGKEEQLYVHFTEDDQEDYLREGDRLFEYSEEL